MSAAQSIWIKSPLYVFAPDQSQPVTGLIVNQGKIETLQFRDEFIPRSLNDLYGIGASPENHPEA